MLHITSAHGKIISVVAVISLTLYTTLHITGGHAHLVSWAVVMDHNLYTMLHIRCVCRYGFKGCSGIPYLV